MRKVMMSILLASAAASPALAQDRWSHGDRGNRGEQHEQSQADRQQSREEHQQAREDRQQAREDRPQVRDNRQEARENRQEAPAPVRAERFRGGIDRAQQEPVERAEVSQPARDERGGFDRSRFQRSDRAEQPSAPQAEFDRRARRDRNGFGDNQSGEVDRNRQAGGWTRDRSNWNRQSGDLRQGGRRLPNVMRTRNPLVVSDTPRPGTQPALRNDGRRWSNHNWNTNWRHDRRYDWHNYRDRHRSTFHVGIYYDPFGWGYQPYQIGFRLWPGYYGRRYWIDNPEMYRLPFAPPGTVWVRYWNDALLVDTYTGEVVDVIHDFFW